MAIYLERCCWLLYFAISSKVLTDGPLCIVALDIAASTPPSSESAILSILNSPLYNKEIRPGLLGNNGSRGPTTVLINMYIRKIDQIDDARMEFKAQINLRQIWNDSRLRYESFRGDQSFVSLDNSLGEKLWTPDLFFPNEASGFVHKMMKPNSLKRVFPSGKVLWSLRLTGTFSCQMDFLFFPHDKQICFIRLESFSEGKAGISIKWDYEQNAPVFMARGSFRNSKFELISYQTGINCSQKSVNESSDYSCAFLILNFKRQPGVYISMIYLPTAMCVILSWITFWLEDAISSRLSLTLTLLLTMTTQNQGATQDMPQVSYIKGIDFWSGCCLCFGSLAILETSTVAYILRQRQKRVTDITQNKHGVRGETMIQLSKMSNPLVLDKLARVLFPLAFSLFVATYCVAFVIGENDPRDVEGAKLASNLL